MGITSSEKRRTLHRLAIGSAWFFALGSLFPLLWLATGMETNGTGDSRVFGINVDGKTYTVPGLTYSGLLGGLLLWTEIIALASANVLTVLPSRTLRRAGLWFLTWWSAYWMLGVFRLALVEFPSIFTIQTPFFALLCAASIYRQCKEWSATSGPRLPGTERFFKSLAPAKSADDELIDEALEEEEHGCSSALYGGLRTDESPLPALLRKRDVPESPTLREIPLSPSAARPDKPNSSPAAPPGSAAQPPLNLDALKLDSIKAGAKRAMVFARQLNANDSLKLKAAGQSLRRGTAWSLDVLARAAAKGAQRLNAPPSSNEQRPAGDAAPANPPVHSVA